MRFCLAVALLSSSSTSAFAFTAPHQQRAARTSIPAASSIPNGSNLKAVAVAARSRDSASDFISELEQEDRSRNLLRRGEKETLAELHRSQHHIEDDIDAPLFVPATYLLESNPMMHNYLEDLSGMPLPKNKSNQEGISYKYMGAQSPHIARGGKLGPLNDGGPGLSSYADSLSPPDEDTEQETSADGAEHTAKSQGKASNPSPSSHIFELPYNKLPEGAVTTSGGPPLKKSRDEQVDYNPVYRYMGPPRSNGAGLEVQWPSQNSDGSGVESYLNSLVTAEDEVAHVSEHEVAESTPVHVGNTPDLSMDGTNDDAAETFVLTSTVDEITIFATEPEVEFVPSEISDVDAPVPTVSESYPVPEAANTESINASSESFPSMTSNMIDTLQGTEDHEATTDASQLSMKAGAGTSGGSSKGDSNGSKDVGGASKSGSGDDVTSSNDGIDGIGGDDGIGNNDDEEDNCSPFDAKHMRMAIDLAQSSGDERAVFPKPRASAVLVAEDGKILGKGCTDHTMDCVQSAFIDAGLDVIPLKEWCVNWPASGQLQDTISKSTLYMTLEPSAERFGEAMPPATELIKMCAISKVVIGCRDPVPERANNGATDLHKSGISTGMGECFADECADLIRLHTETVNSKFQRMARKHFRQTQRPFGFLHCSVVDSDNVEAFARNGNAFGRSFGGKELSFRNLGAYEIAPPPEQVWADDLDGIGAFDEDSFGRVKPEKTPVMPWYEQVDACVATFPKAGNGPGDDDSIGARLNGLKWLATIGRDLPAGVERILVMDATDIEDLPLTNHDPNLPKGVDIVSFWQGEGRKPTRVLLRRGKSTQAALAAEAAAQAAQSAAAAALAAKDAIETGDAESSAQAAIECAKAAAAATEIAQKKMMETQVLKRRLTDLGVVVETLQGGEPIDVMKHLGRRNAYKSVVWRAGCWGNRGVKAILDGAFQWVSSHLAVDAKGGKFWQLMLAERAIQAACGPESKVKILSSDEDISMEYCDQPNADSECTLTVNGRAIRHIRLDCRVNLADKYNRPHVVKSKTRRLDKRRLIEEEAPWFL